MAGRLRLRLRRAPSLESLFVAVFALLGLRLGLRPLGDNSTFQHLRTGVDLVAGHGLPRHDPYSFTAHGTPWVVQSWLVDVAYGMAHRAGGWHAVVVLHGLLYALLAWLTVRLARTGTAWRTALAGAVVVGVALPYWSPRPLVVGLTCLALTVTLVERQWSPWWLLPVGWLWVNSHGSWILGLGWLVLVVVGETVDRRLVDWRALSDGPGGDREQVEPGPSGALRALGALAAGVLAGAVNPLGPRLLGFPFALVDRHDLFSRVVEWQPPRFDGPVGVLLLVSLTGLVVAVARGRLAWRDLLPVAGLLAAGLLSQRNLAALSVVAAPVLGRALRDPSLGFRTDGAAAAPPAQNGLIAAMLAVLAAVFVAVGATAPAFDLSGYPVALLRDPRAQGRLVAPDVIGGYSILTKGRAAGVFVDDRVDMYPRRVIDDSLVLVDGKPATLAVLDRYRADAVVWRHDRPLATILAASGRWRLARRSGDWALFVRA